ncbi:hypothetical protein [uncultured Marinobacter sp.]|uniref:hypothetical protein n=1 Tax=uncultured Marinobacter sp. TaxID=187379 RepID=UPI0030DCF835|tara:strand:- start:352 stop:741 length:390 start_codon:yes stop_codon:yes gene_type:complete
MKRTASIVAVGLVTIGIAEIAVRGADTSLWAWRLLFVLWIVALFKRFTLAAVDAYKAVFAKGPNEEIRFPEFEQKTASFNRGGEGKASGSSHCSTNPGHQGCTDNPFDDFPVNPIIREDDPFGEFLDTI